MKLNTLNNEGWWGKSTITVRTLQQTQRILQLVLLMSFSLGSLQLAKAQQEPASDSTKQSKDLPWYARDRYGILNPGFYSNSPLLLPTPGLRLTPSLDSTGLFYNLNQTFSSDSSLFFRPPSRISFRDYQDYQYQQMMRKYWKKISYGQDGDNDGADGEDPDDGRLIPPIELSPKIGRFLGGNTIDIRMNGNVVLDFGGLWQRVDNPQIPVRQQRNGGFNFDQQIGMNLSGKIGEAIELNTNFDTKNAFQFEQVYNLGYTAYEHDIVQEVQLGNVSFPVSNSLITGAQNLFGVSTRLRFGKLWISAVASSQRGTSEQITIKNGAQAREFELRAHEYDLNRHFFLAQFFRDNYERSLQSIPAITSGVVVTRVEAYVTNRNNNTQTLRNVVALMDLAEGAPYATDNPNVGQAPPGPARNGANALFENARNNPNVRNPDLVSNELENGFGLEKGGEFELLRAARKLEPNEFTFHPQLGYISLVTPLRNDEILAVSFEYTYNGEVYKVGELNEDYASLEDEQTILLKMLTPSTIRTDLPVWDLMMKNIYTLQANQLVRDNFQLRVIYRDDLTGIDNPSLHEGAQLKDIPLVQIMGLDRLNQNNDPQRDGNFDFIPGITIDVQTGRIIFPVLEPFGSHLETFFNPVAEENLIEKYVFDGLYRGTQADALLNTTKNKFFLKGSYQSGSSNEIILPGINIAPNSVIVRVGNSPLTEGVDYTVDYQFGRVRIMNEGALNSGREITIQYERADLFSFQTRNLLGVDAEYHFSKDIRFTGTLLHLNERPIISRVSIGSEPVRNTLWGLGVDYQTKSRFLTKMVDKLPFLSTKAESSLNFKAEFAQLIPGSPRLLQSNGTSFIDDFEGAEIPYDLTRNPVSWVLGSTPQLILNRTPNTSPLSSGYKRAKLAWYSIDNVFYFSSGGANRSRPITITDEDLENNYVRLIPFNEVFPNRQREQVITPEISFDLAYYPNERGPYNFNPDLNPDGTLKEPEENFGAITRAINHDIDFDNINIQYIEFWMMDPFLEGENGRVEGENNQTGGELYFNLGNISEDIMPDDRHFFENGLVADENALAITDWGRTPTQQYITDAFDAADGARAIQDVGFDGLNNEQEVAFFDDQFLRLLPNSLSPEARAAIEADPSADNFQYYLGEEADQNDLGILERYKNFNGMENNSPENNGGQDFTPSSTNLPDNEDLNRDNTISDLDQYYQYRVELKPTQLENHPFVVDRVQATAPETGDVVNWYQFRIPIRGDHVETVGNINGYKSIRFIRMFLTQWQQPVVLRLVQFQLVGAQWRPYERSLKGGGLDVGQEPPIVPDFTVTTVNIEENGQNDGVNTPYTLPPNAIRDFDATSTVTRQLNEQSLQVCIDDLQDDDAIAIYKNVVVDMVNYQRLKMDIHAESREAGDGDVSAFIRLGTDFEENYYEIEMPLVMTPIPSTDPQAIWPEENRLDIALKELYLIKAQRNREGANPSRVFPLSDAPNVEGKYTVRVKGNPDISSVQTVMLGLRNPDSPDNQPKQVCVWYNELRVTDFDNTAGWAVNATLNTQLADFATLRTSLRYSTFGFGGIQDKISNRQRSTNLDYDISSNINLDKFLLGKVGIRLPLFVGYQRSTSDPFFDPLNPDLPLADALASFNDPQLRADYQEKTQDFYEARSINLSNVSKQKMKQGAKSYLWDIENISLNASYSDSYMRNINTEELTTRQWQIGATYAYSSKGLPIEPFKNSKAKFLEKAYLKWLKEFNFNLLPSNILVQGVLNRRYMKTQLRNRDLTTEGILPQYEKAFTFDRNYSVQWQFTKALGLDYTANANAIIDEPEGDVSGQAARDSIMTNLRNLGRMKNFRQSVALNYTLPFDKFPLTDFLNTDARYTADYQWTAGAVGLADTLGNNLQNAATINVNGKIDMNKLYNKIPFLKRINDAQRQRSRSRNSAGQPPRPSPQDDPLSRKKDRVQARLDRLLEKSDKKESRLRKKLLKWAQRDSVQLAKDSLAILEDSLGAAADTMQIELGLPEATINLLLYDSLKTKKLRRLSGRRQRLEEKIVSIEEEQARRKQNNVKPPEMKFLKGVIRTAMAVRDINFTYSRNAATILPGFLPTPSLFGMDAAWESPGLPFVLGSQSPSIKQEAARNGWLGSSVAQNNPFSQIQTEEFSINTSLEPAPDLKIQLQAKKSRDAAYSEIFRYVPSQDDFVTQTPMRTGSYGISFFMMGTAFSADDDNNNSPVFSDFEENRAIIKQRLDALNPAGEYDINSQDVLIPAFLAAYTGKDAGSSSLNAFPNIPIPNWRLTYTGLSKIPVFKDMFKSVSITHGYTSEYLVGNYTSSLFYGSSSITLDISERNTQLANADDQGNLVPVFVMNQVTLTEKFSPLIGVNIRAQNDMQININFNRGRDLALNLTNAQVTENRTNDVTVDIGYTKAGMKLPFSIRGVGNVLENDVTMRVAFTLRDTRTVQRKIGEGSIVTAGNMNLQFKPTISYAVNKRSNVQLYFERTINDPRVSNSFRRTSTAFGVQFRYNLSQ